jgi:hypothetical protein
MKGKKVLMALVVFTLTGVIGLTTVFAASGNRSSILTDEARDRLQEHYGFNISEETRDRIQERYNSRLDSSFWNRRSESGWQTGEKPEIDDDTIDEIEGRFNNVIDGMQNRFNNAINGLRNGEWPDSHRRSVERPGITDEQRDNIRNSYNERWVRALESGWITQEAFDRFTRSGE